ncbi:RDD family protein [Indiicoccus explosivorum]|uniref:RDD family protein n=1 Tax=Indiicoccus explosivorum TaxID=1917864 RepID=UPI000B42E53B|nr:RDD family protein [Indiicoccus explosivorum]
MLFEYDRYAGFWIRVLAAIIDSIILYAPFYILDAVLFYQITGMREGEYRAAQLNAGVFPEDITVPDEVVIYSYIGTAVIGILYFGLLTASRWQGTFGKLAVGIKVVGKDGGRIGFFRSVLRYFGYIPAGLLLGFGYLMIALDERKQGLHDKIAGTYVIHKQPK